MRSRSIARAVVLGVVAVLIVAVFASAQDSLVTEGSQLLSFSVNK